MTDIDAIRASHVPFTEDIDVPTVCAHERVRWPCDTAIVLAALETNAAITNGALDRLNAAIERDKRLRAELSALPKTSIRDGSPTGRFIVDWLDLQAILAAEAVLDD